MDPLVSGSAMVISGHTGRARLRAEAVGEVVMGIAAGAGALVAGIAAAILGWSALGLGAGVVGLLAAAGIRRCGRR